MDLRTLEQLTAFDYGMYALTSTSHNDDRDTLRLVAQRTGEILARFSRISGHAWDVRRPMSGKDRHEGVIQETLKCEKGVWWLIDSEDAKEKEVGNDCEAQIEVILRICREVVVPEARVAAVSLFPNIANVVATEDVMSVAKRTDAGRVSEDGLSVADRLARLNDEFERGIADYLNPVHDFSPEMLALADRAGVRAAAEIGKGMK